MLRSLWLFVLLFTTTVALAQKNTSLKLSTNLRERLSKKAATDSIDVSISIKPDKAAGRYESVRILKTYAPANIIIARVRVGNLDQLASKNELIFISETLVPKEELTTGAVDFTLNRINYTQNRFPQLKGDSVSSSVKERLFDTADIDLKGRVFITGLENTEPTSHASLMATIIAGGGNSSPFARGAAPASKVTSTSFLNLFPETDSFYRRYKISVQNHSYGTVVENFYGNEAVAYDVSSVNNPTLLPVFSAGNSGNITTTTGPYAGVQEVANLSGNFKQAKNIITVSAVDSTGQVMPLSSKGPAYDGRVKPELVAYGEDGSSGAAALVSGASVLVQDAYKQKHNGLLPPSMVTKAALLNSADDVGIANVDYQSGYGNMNAYKAVQTINEDRYFESSLSQNEVKNFPITVPGNLAKLKITLVWSDPAATPNASKALVNDLDATLRLPATGESWLPWVLNPMANKDSLALPALRKRDTLNNIEQITVDNPAAGSYTLEIKGAHITTAAQAFAIAYQFDTARIFYWTYPAASDPLIASNTHTLRWETTLAGSGQLDYSTNGTTWQAIATVPDVSKKYFKWAVPDTVTTAMLRMTMAPSASVVTDTFTISPQLALQAGFNCMDSFLLEWNALPVRQYQLYELGGRYLAPFQQTPDTFSILKAAQHPALFYAVAPVINGRAGIRSNTLNYSTQGVGCYLRSFFLQTQTPDAAFFRAGLGTLFNVAEVSFEKKTGNDFVALKTITKPSATNFIFADSALHQGENFYRLKIKLTNGTLLYSAVETAYYVPVTTALVLYPNPVRQSGTLKLITNEVGRYTIRIYDSNGRFVYEQPLNSSLTHISATILRSGLYLVQILDKNGKPTVQKLIVY
jgi:hypothetical protein